MTNEMLAPSLAATETAAKRDVRYDLLRIAAAFMVVFLHTAAAEWHNVPADSFNWAVMNAYDCLVRSAVPLFFMLSGTFLLTKEPDIKKLYLRRILPLLGIYSVWSVLYAVDTITLTVLFQTPLSAFLRVAAQGTYHLWFIPTLIGLYILLPVLHAIARFEKGKYVPYFLLCFLVFGILRETLFAFLKGYETATALLTKIPVELTGSAGYMLLGHFLAQQKKIRLRTWVALLLFSSTTVLSAAVNLLHAYAIGAPSDILYGYLTLPVFAEAILLFLCFQNMKADRLSSPKAAAVIEKCAALTFGIYLLHPFILTHLEQNLHLHVLSFSPILSVPAIAFLAFLLSAAVTFLMLKIPFINRLWKL